MASLPRESTDTERRVDAGHAVCAAALLMDHPDPGEQLGIACRSPRWRALLPGPEAARGDTEQAAHRAHVVVGPLSLDEPVRAQRVRSVSLAKNAAAFTRIVRSSSSTFTRRRSVRSSSRSSVVRPSARPASISACLDQRRSDSRATPRSRATSSIGGCAGETDGFRSELGGIRGTPRVRNRGLLLRSLPHRVRCRRNRVNSSTKRDDCAHTPELGTPPGVLSRPPRTRCRDRSAGHSHGQLAGRDRALLAVGLCLFAIRTSFVSVTIAITLPDSDVTLASVQAVSLLTDTPYGLIFWRNPASHRPHPRPVSPVTR
jgi:hypothetical protein